MSLELASLVVLAITLGCLAYQVWLQRRTAFGEFVVALEEQWGRHSAAYERYGADPQKRSEELEEGDRSAIERYFAFFENVGMLVEHGILPIQRADVMFHYRLFSMLNCRACRRVLRDKAEYFQAIHVLQDRLIEFGKEPTKRFRVNIYGLRRSHRKGPTQELELAIELRSQCDIWAVDTGGNRSKS